MAGNRGHAATPGAAGGGGSSGRARAAKRLALPAKVLVVDDEPSIRLLGRVNLELDGHGVLGAHSLTTARAALAAILARYADLFTRPQLELLREAEESADGDEREQLHRLRKACERGLVEAVTAGDQDALENAFLAARLSFDGEELPLRSADAKLAVVPDYAKR